jgi:hypothetical protein
MTTTNTPTLDEAKLEAFVGQAVVDMGAAISGLLRHLGDRLGLYQAMAGTGPITSATLAPTSGCGYGASTIIMAQAFEHSRFAGFDIHQPSIQSAEQPQPEPACTHG